MAGLSPEADLRVEKRYSTGTFAEPGFPSARQAIM